VTTVTASVRTPYKGLSAIDDSELDALLFFGRERETEIVVANALASRLTVLYGPSGVGKSSLLRAGVLRSMRKLSESEPLAVAYLSSWAGDPVAGIEEAARGALAEAFGGDPGDAPGDLAEGRQVAVPDQRCERGDQLSERGPRGGRGFGHGEGDVGGHHEHRVVDGGPGLAEAQVGGCDGVQCRVGARSRRARAAQLVS